MGKNIYVCVYVCVLLHSLQNSSRWKYDLCMDWHLIQEAECPSSLYTST